MDEYYALVKKLPEPFRTELSGLNTQIAPFVQEIRLRVGQPVMFTMKGRLSPCIKYLPRAGHCQRVPPESIQACFLALCRHSAYAYEEELAQGFFTIPGGNRIGVAGTRGASGFSAVTSLNLRVARWITCELTTPVQEHLENGTGGLLVAGAPGSGKTTLLRLIAGLEKPAVGDVYKTGRIALLPQQPLLLFTKDTVKEEFCDNKASSDVIELCNISHLLSRHPTELSGGELQRCAIALLLSMDFDTLLLDEPSKGMDKESVELLGQIIKALKGNKTIICVSHDTDFAAESSDRCAMLFGGDIISLENKEKFFSGNEFFTTDGVIISKGIKDNVVSDNDLIYTVTGKYPEKSDIKIPADNPTENKKAPFPLYRKICLGLGAVTGIISLLMAGGVIPLKFPGGQYSGLLTLIVPVILLIIGLGIKNRKFTPDRGKIPTITQILVGTFTLISVPLTIALGNMLTDERKWLFISILVLIECIMPFFFLFELKRPSPKEIVLLSIMCGIAIAGREIFFFLPQVKPVAALVIISGVAFGWQAGFITGAVTMLVSNLLFGQGVYTPFQMLAMGLVGFFAGVIFRRGCNTAGLLIYGFLSVFLLYGPIMNISQALLYTNSNIKTILAAEIAGIPMDIIHGISTVAFLLLGGVQLLPVLLRAVKKSGAFK